MIDIGRVFEDRALNESGCAGRIRHLFDSGDLTFADMRDIFTKVFSGDIELVEKIDGINLFVTYKGGDFRIARDRKSLADPMDYARVDAKYCDAPKEVRDAFEASLRDLAAALPALDPVALNRYFANGQNFLNCEIVYPPCRNVLDYGNRCVIVLHGIRCYNDRFVEIGEDRRQAEELFAAIRDGGRLRQETFEITEPNVLRLRDTTSAKDALARILARLGEFIDGVGWKCSLAQYVVDKYSRHIVNKALEHGIDVSRTSDFVNALAQRLSQVSGRRPTKSDLRTYAKDDGVDSSSQAYRDFLQELEDGCDETNAAIIKPVEDLIMWAGDTLLKNVTGFMAVDPSKTAKRLYADIQAAVGEVEDGVSGLTPEKIDRFKRNLAKIDRYQECAPSEGVVITYKGRPLKLVGKFGPINQLLGILKYR